MAIKKGDKVTFKPEFQDAGDDQITFIAACDEYAGRVQVSAQIGFAIEPVQVVLISMIESVQSC